MKLTKRIWTLLLAVCMLATMAVVPANADAGSNVFMTVDKTEVTVGDTIDVVLTVDDITAEGFGTYLEFDNTLLELTFADGIDRDGYFGLYAKSGKGQNWTEAVTNANNEEGLSLLEHANLNGRFSFGIVPGIDTQFVGGEYAILTFEAIAEGTASFVLNEDTAGTNEFKGIAATEEVVIGGAASAPVGFAGYQTTSYGVRFIGYTDSLEYDSVELKVTVEGGKTYSKSTGTVYKTLTGTVDGEKVNVVTCDPEVDALQVLPYGYLYGFALVDIDAGTYSVTVETIATLDGEVVESTTAPMEISVDGDGVVTVTTL